MDLTTALERLDRLASGEAGDLIFSSRAACKTVATAYREAMTRQEQLESDASRWRWLCDTESFYLLDACSISNETQANALSDIGLAGGDCYEEYHQSINEGEL